MMYHLIKLVLIMITAFLVQIKSQTANNTEMLETTVVPSQINTLGTTTTSNSTEREVLCTTPGLFPNGWIDTAENLSFGMSKVGRNITYRCNSNMKQIGALHAICEPSGRWSKNPPQCLFPCTLPVVDHGTIRNNGSIIPHGENVTLECEQSYQPAHGLWTYKCDNGTFLVTPRCDPAPKGNCDRPEIPNGTFVQIDGENVTRNQIYAVGTKIIYTCINSEHRMIDDITKKTAANNSSRICDKTTKNWTGIAPKCVATCGSLHSQFNVSYGEKALVGERYHIGTRAIIYCIAPSTAANNTTWVCQSNGTWQGAPIICYKKREHLDFLEIVIIAACLVSIVIIFMALVFLYKTRSSGRQPNPAKGNSYHVARSNSTESAQRMRSELLRQIRRQSFYSLEDPAAGEREYATVHRMGHSMRPRMTVQYGKLG